MQNGYHQIGRRPEEEKWYNISKVFADEEAYRQSGMANATAEDRRKQTRKR